MSVEPAKRHRPPANGTCNVLLLLGGGLTCAFAVIALFTNYAARGMLLILASLMLIVSFTIWVSGTDILAPERWTPGTRHTRLAVVALVALTYAACSWNDYANRSDMHLTVYELQPLLMVLLLILPRPANRKSRAPAGAAKGA